ncbi:hypothetical protein LTR16_000424 [Cryomyces antarcticus]|uniref:Uncharacterized protein n=1 Tax=Cryomyces antarcticus TaxID=329879 RepID=A0ABR0M089_9PEZI|nr:hypothetical protein LTR16_000424 [Cryomyces antarcticus]
MHPRCDRPNQDQPTAPTQTPLPPARPPLDSAVDHEKWLRGSLRTGDGSGGVSTLRTRKREHERVRACGEDCAGGVEMGRSRGSDARGQAESVEFDAAGASSVGLDGFRGFAAAAAACWRDGAGAGCFDRWGCGGTDAAAEDDEDDDEDEGATGKGQYEDHVA